MKHKQVFKSRNFLGTLHKYRCWFDTSIKVGRPDLRPVICSAREQHCEFDYYILYVPSELYTLFYLDSLPF